MEEKTVYFIRHGQSEGNIGNVYQKDDSPLSEIGKKQADVLAKRISRISFDALISSPLTRTHQTTDAITRETGKTCEFSNLFVERIKPTGLAGRSKNDDEAIKIWNEWEESLCTPGMRVKDGENFDDLIKRADDALDYLNNRPEKTIVVVTSGYFLRAIIARVLIGEGLTGDIFKHFQGRIISENTGISVLKYRESFRGNRWRLWVYNDHAHLG